MAVDPTRSTHAFELLLNPSADPDSAYGAAQQSILNDSEYQRARQIISAWPGYAVTPLVELPGLASALGLGQVHYKDESGRFGLGSFKALGGAYAVARLLQRRLADAQGREPTIEELLSGRYAELTAGVTVCCATDGNHGRSVAWGARLFGCRCVIFIHATVSDTRKQAIEAFGAQIVRTAGNYDDSVRTAQQQASDNGWYVVSDTSYPGYMDVPKDVMQGYTVMAAEALEQLGDARPPTHVLLQTGVGGMAAAVAATCWQWLRPRPRIILADPDRSACWLASLRAGEPTPVGGDLDTIMAGLACGEVSLLAWSILRPAADAVITVADAAAEDAMRLLADSPYGDPPLVGGESAVAGLAALVAVAGDADSRQRLALDGHSRVLLFGTEGDTDPGVYRHVVGRDADQVRARAGAA